MTVYLTVDHLLIIAEAIGVKPTLRDSGLLDSAAARPQTMLFGADAYPSLWDKAASLMHSVVRNHAFVDGNKRVGLTAALAFLHVNGVRTEPFNDDEAYKLTVGVAAGDFDDVAEIAGRLRKLLNA